MRRILLLSLCLAAMLVGQTAWAADGDTVDITSTYLQNPSFEDDEMSEFSKITNSADGFRGWDGTPRYWSVNGTSVTQLLVDSTCYTDNNFGKVTTLADGDYAFYLRLGWSTGTTTFSQTTQSALPAGTYRLSMDQRTGYANSATSSFTLSAGSTTSSSVTFSQGSTDLTYYPNLEWTTTSVDFTLEEAGTVDIVVTVTWASGGSCIMMDNFKLYSIPASSDEDSDDDDDEEETVTIDEGVYYLKVSGEYHYMTQGGWWGTAAVVDEIGMPLTLTALSDGTYTLLNAENGSSSYIYTTSSSDIDVYTDATGAGYAWNFIAADGGGYYIQSPLTNQYFSYTDQTSGPDGDGSSHTYYVSRIVGTTSTSSAVVWELLSEDEYAASLLAKLDEQAAAAATAAGISDVSSVEGLETYLETAVDEASLFSVDVTSKIVNSDFEVSILVESDTVGWDPVSYSTSRTRSKLGYFELTSWSEILDIGEINAIAYIDKSMGMEQTLSGLAEGLYKVETYAVFSPVEVSEVLLGDGVDEDELDISSAAFAYAKTASTEAYNEVMGYQGESFLDWNNLTEEGKVPVYADSILPNYTNTNYIYVKDGEKLTIGLAHERHNSGNTVLNWHWTLTYYTDEAYTIGSPTYSITDQGTIDPEGFDGTVSVAFNGATSIYEDAALSLLNESATITLIGSDGNTYTGTITANDDGTYTITITDADLASGTTYTLTIPAGTIGYNDSNANEELTLTFYTECDVEGKYYLKVADEDSYLSRGSNWATRAVTDAYGAPLELAYTDESLLTIKYLDNSGESAYLFEADATASTIYTDNNTYPYWIIRTVDSVEGGYVIYDGNSSDSYGQPLCLDSDGNLAVVEDGEAIIWTIQSFEEHNAYLNGLADDQAIAAAAEIGLTVESKEALSELLADESLFSTADVTITGKTSASNSEAYETATGSWENSDYTVFEETVSSLEAGLYKVSVNAFFRISNNATTDSLYNAWGDLAQGSAFLIANEEQVQLVSLMSEGYDTAQEENSSLADYLGSDGTYHPNSTTQGDYAFEQGLYNNDIYVYVGEEGELTFSIVKTVNHTPSNWIYYDNFSVTQYTLIAELGDSLDYSSVEPADGDTVEALSTITLTYDEEVTLADDDAVIYVTNAAGDTLTTATIAADGTTVTITLAEDIDDYDVSCIVTIPAGTIGDATAASSSFQYGNANGEITLNYTTESFIYTVEDGNYYFKVSGEYQYLQRAGNWGTELTLGSVGTLFTLNNNGDNTFYLTTTDAVAAGSSGIYVTGPTSAYVDASSGAATWSLEEAGDGTYYIVNSNGNYLTGTYYEDATYGYAYYYIGEATSDAPAFEVISKAEYLESLSARLDDQAATAAEAAGLSATTVEELETAVAAYYTYDQDVDYSDFSAIYTNGATGIYAAAAISDPTIEVYNGCGGAELTLDSLTEGLYKVTLNAMSRAFLITSYYTTDDDGNTVATDLADVSSDAAFIYANDAIDQTAFYSDYEGYLDVNSISDFTTAAEAGAYEKVLYVYVADGDDLTIGFQAPYRTNYEASWTITANWTVTLLSEDEIVDDTETGISSISSDSTFEPTAIYSVSGQLVRTQATSFEGLNKGIYIVNGQKVLVK